MIQLMEQAICRRRTP